MHQGEANGPMTPKQTDPPRLTKPTRQMALINIKAHIDCEVCGEDYTVTLDQTDMVAWEALFDAIGSDPMQNGGFLDGEFICPECLRAFDAAEVSGERALGDVVLSAYADQFRTWRKAYQDFLDDAEELPNLSAD